MVNNFISINETNNHLSPQTNEQKKRPQMMALENQVMACDMHKQVVGSKTMHAKILTTLSINGKLFLYYFAY